MTNPTPGYAAVVTSDTVVINANGQMKSVQILNNPEAFRKLRQAIEQEKPLSEIEVIFAATA